MDKVFLRNLILYGYHGATTEEQVIGRQFRANISVSLDVRGAATEDDLSRTVNYATLTQIAKQEITGKPAKLVETVAERIAASILRNFEIVREVVVTLEKLTPPVGETAEAAGVEITRRRET